jgi:hypothetical protein
VERNPQAIARGLHDALLPGGPVDGGAVRAHLSLARIGHQVIDVYREAMARRGRA